MNTLAALLCAGILFSLSSCYGHPPPPRSDSSGRAAMVRVTDTVTIAGPAEAVFDIVTTARFWPQWHPATEGVGGVAERPYGLGDRIYERGRIGNQKFETSWKVVEHVRPSRVVLQSEHSSTRISYSFQRSDGGTVFTRELEYDPEIFAAVAADRFAVENLMRAQSEQATRQLKALAEKIIRAETFEVR